MSVFLDLYRSNLAASWISYQTSIVVISVEVYIVVINVVVHSGNLCSSLYGSNIFSIMCIYQ